MRALEAQDLHAELVHVASLHMLEFEPVRRATVEAAPVDEERVVAEFEAAEVEGIGAFKRKARNEARQRAQAKAARRIAELRAAAEADVARDQALADENWSLLESGDEPTVLAAVNAAFEDNEATAAAVGYSAGELLIVMLAPPPEAIPERMPSVTPGGKATVKKMNKTDRNEFYRQLVCGHVFATVKEAFAFAPSATSARIVSMRENRVDAYGKRVLEPLLAAVIKRARLAGVEWTKVDAHPALIDIASELLIDVRGATKELHPLDLAREEALAALISSIDMNAAIDAPHDENDDVPKSAPAVEDTPDVAQAARPGCSRGCLWLVALLVGIPVLAGLIAWNNERKQHAHDDELRRECRYLPDALKQSLVRELDSDLSGMVAVKEGRLWYMVAGARAPGSQGSGRATGYGWVTKELSADAQRELIYGRGAETIGGVIQGHDAFGEEVTEYDPGFERAHECGSVGLLDNALRASPNS